MSAIIMKNFINAGHKYAPGCVVIHQLVLALAFVLMWSYSSALMWVEVLFFCLQSYLLALALGVV